MLVYYFVPFIVSNRYLLFWVSNGHNSLTVQNRTHVYMNFFHHKNLGNHLLQLCPKVLKHPVHIAGPPPQLNVLVAPRLVSPILWNLCKVLSVKIWGMLTYLMTNLLTLKHWGARWQQWTVDCKYCIDCEGWNNSNREFCWFHFAVELLTLRMLIFDTVTNKIYSIAVYNFELKFMFWFIKYYSQGENISWIKHELHFNV